MDPVVVTASFALSSSPSDVWPFITDTDRTNRLLMTSGATFKPIEPGAKTGARFVVETRTGGFAMSYEEAPFEWTLHKRFSVYRKMRSGPLRSYTFAVALEPSADGGTTVTARIELDPVHWALRPIARMQSRRFIAGLARLGEEIDAHVRDRAPSPFLKPASPANEERLAHASAELEKRSIDKAAIAAVIDLIRSGPDADLVRIRPFEVAHHANVDGREVLRALLHAVTLGVVELRWALVCPSCRTANDQVSSLSALGEGGHCQLCDLSYGLELDRAVEATFAPHPSVREVTDRMFCIGGPWRTPHVVVQANVDAKAERELDVPPEPGRYRLFGRGGAVASVVVEKEAPEKASVSLDRAFEPGEVTVSPKGTIVVANRGADSLHVKIERLGYASFAATAHLVTTMDEFRRLFSRELLKPSTPLKVASCAILFSDLTGSTALYTKAGDAAAFRLVDDHFDVLRKVIGDAGGTVVKTMGDAVMAAFVEPLGAVRAAAQCVNAFEEFRRTAENGELTGLKVGLYAGPCYVVTANDVIDYFGQTVNCASRVQHLAESGEIIFEEDVWTRLSDDDRKGLTLLEKLETRVKGVEEPLRLVRTKPSSSSRLGAEAQSPRA